jgi:hypothetical protein
MFPSRKMIRNVVESYFCNKELSAEHADVRLKPLCW